MSDPSNGTERFLPTPSPAEGDVSTTKVQERVTPLRELSVSEFPSIPGYEILGELGRGGMGVVYRARQVGANRVVALKMIVSGDAAGATEVARFRIEADAVARLLHPNLVAVFEVGEHGGRPFFSMEYCPKGSLAAAVRGKSLTPHEATEILLAVARGVATAHAAGIVHRDLKPQNVMLAADGTPKVADFGLAKKMAAGESDGPTQTGAILGTPAYMAPEQAFGNSKYVGPEADVYALGATLYALLTGQPPFTAPTPMETVLQVVGEEPKRPRSLRRDIPADLEAICLKCLEKDRRHRYPTAAELADDLSRFLKGEAVSAVRSGWMGRVVGAMERVPLEGRFAEYGTILLALAPIMFLPELWVQLTIANEWPLYHLILAQYGRITGVFLTIGSVRKWKLLPHGPVERHLWTVMAAYVLSCIAVGVGIRLTTEVQTAAVELKLYQPFAALTGLAFFALASSFWGYSAVVGLAFFALTIVMGFDLRFAPIMFGTAWAVVLVILGTRLRRLSRNP